MITIPDNRQYYQMSAAVCRKQNAILWSPRCSEAAMQELRRANAALLSSLLSDEVSEITKKTVKKCK